MRKYIWLLHRALAYVVGFSVVIENVTGGSKEIIAVADRYMINTVIRTGSLYSEHVASPGQCCIMCLSTSSCVSFYFNSIARECLPHSTIYQPSDTSVTELNWKYFIVFDYRDTWRHFQGQKYYFPPNISRTWGEAKSFCESIGAYLVQIETQEEQTWLSSQLVTGVWIGLNDLTAHGRYVWGDDNAIPTFYNWNQGEPNIQNERCVFMILRGAEGLWYDAPCDYKLHIICEK